MGVTHHFLFIYFLSSGFQTRHYNIPDIFWQISNVYDGRKSLNRKLDTILEHTVPWNNQYGKKKIYRPLFCSVYLCTIITWQPLGSPIYKVNL